MHAVSWHSSAFVRAAVTPGPPVSTSHGIASSPLDPRPLPRPQVKEDPEWPRLSQVPNLLDPWNDIRDKFNTATDEFKVGQSRW